MLIFVDIIISIGDMKGRCGMETNNQLQIQMGKRVSARRKALALTQEQLAEKMNVSIQMISNLELGKKAIRPENIVKLCSVLDISADYLLTGNNTNDQISEICDKLIHLSSEELNAISNLIELLSKK